MLQRVRTRLAAREAEFVREIVEETNPTDFGKSYIADALQLAHEALDFMQNRPTVESGSDFSPWHTARCCLSVAVDGQAVNPSLTCRSPLVRPPGKAIP